MSQNYLPTEGEVIRFFDSRTGYQNVFDISTGLVAPHIKTRSQPSDEEWKHVRGLLHVLKVDGYLLVQNEGSDIYNEKFTSTPEKIKKYFDAKSPLTTEDGRIIPLNLLIREIKSCYSLGESELLEHARLENTQRHIREGLGKIVSETPNEILQLKYKKLNGGLQTILKSGFHNRATAESKLEIWRLFIEEIIQSLSITQPITETYFSSGQQFDAVKTLRSMLSAAKTKIWIEDNFLHPNIISTIEPYITNGNIEIRFLTRRQGNPNINSFSIDLKKFKSQYPNSNIEARENNQCHDRYLIIDESDIYHSGHSFHDLGGKASQINNVENESNKNKIFADFESWWRTGTSI